MSESRIRNFFLNNSIIICLKTILRKTFYGMIKIKTYGMIQLVKCFFKTTVKFWIIRSFKYQSEKNEYT